MGIFCKLEKLKQIKGQIKSSLINRNVYVDDKTYEQYPELILNIDGYTDVENIVNEILGESL